MSGVATKVILGALSPDWSGGFCANFRPRPSVAAGQTCTSHGSTPDTTSAHRQEPTDRATSSGPTRSHHALGWRCPRAPVRVGVMMAMIGDPTRRRAAAVEDCPEDQEVLDELVELESSVREQAMITNSYAQAPPKAARSRATPRTLRLGSGKRINPMIASR